MKTFEQRVKYATTVIALGRPTTREFDNCFEMWDGEIVVTALVRKAFTHPGLFAGIVKQWGGKFPRSWVETAGRHAHVTTHQLPAAARAIRAQHEQDSIQ